MSETTKRERVVVVTTSFPRSEGDAAGHFVLAEVRALQRAGADVLVLAAGDSSYAPIDCRVRFLGGGELFTWPGVLPRLRENPGRALHALRFVREARRALVELGKIDRIVAHWLVPSAFPIAVPRARTGKRPRLQVTAHGSDVRVLLRLPERLRRGILTMLFDERAELRFVSQALRTELLERTELPRHVALWLERAVVAPAAIELPASLNRTSARETLRLDDAMRLVVIAGRLVPEKRIDVALRAAELVPRAVVVVMGSGPEFERLRAEFPDVRFLGQVPRGDALTWLAAADVLVNASLEEGAPTVVREARALGVPVVARPCGDLTLWADTDDDLWLV